MEKFYVVMIVIHVNGYEKIVPHLVTAKNPREAGREAIIRECHDDPEDLEWMDGGAYDLGGEFYYEILSIQEVMKGDEEVLRVYLW